MRSSKKRVKMFEYFRSKIHNHGMVFLQETDSSEKSQNKWHNEFKEELHFSHGKNNSCGVMIWFINTKKHFGSKTSKASKGRIPIIEITIEEVHFILVNLYNANTQVEQIKTLCELGLLLDEFLLDDSKTIIIAGDLNLLFYSNLETSGDLEFSYPEKNMYFKGLTKTALQRWS